ncbi:DUF2207 domain-containing protein [Chryseobacterium potabilaquae]|uniref:DUF2207 domain-containing protein n=1 Tax=Chryseobacterium potabilaquae TaxID=2675057 RepID=A0A6N4X6U3_9FLAO|nr:DUF2207 domain-containing protein [Chryseobacterium potabilaquae]CAA7194959.1 hypothetical protein CHRY9293_01223 [Chryseobacterium potabilaquae]
MKKVLLFFHLLFYATTFAQEQDKIEVEKILYFHSDLVIDKNSAVTVTENIKVHSLGEYIKRGIYRVLPLSRNLNNRTQKVKYEIISVKKNGVDEEYHEKIEDGFLKIYVGNKDVILDPGDYDYEIQYKTDHQIGFFEKYDELYWNVNGTAWDFPIDSLSAKVILPEGSKIVQNSCYKGAYGSTSRDCTSKILSDNSIEWSAYNLGINEGLSIAAGFQKGIMIPPPPPTFLEIYGILIGGFIVLSALVFYYYSTWRKYGVDPVKPIVYPQFSIPENLSPASLGYIKTENFKNKYITASIISLAVKGYIKIVESEETGILGFFHKKIFTLKKLKQPGESLPKEEHNLMNSLFKGGNDIVRFDGKYDEKIETAVNNFKETLKLQHDEFLNEGNNGSKIVFPFLLVTVVYIIGLFLSYRMYPEVEKLIVGGFLYIVFLVVFIVIALLVKNLSWKFLIPLPFLLLFGMGNMINFGHDAVVSNNFNICYIFIVIGFVSLIIYQYLIKRPSEEKLKKQSLIEGFKMYMGAAENEQLKFHNPPQMTPQIFEALLPFAMVLGVDEIWGKKFDEIVKKMSTEYNNTWYHGTSMNYYSFTNTLNSSLTNSIQTASTQPSSSGSGSGGGGFSGGGGGGGGGGGW